MPTPITCPVCGQPVQGEARVELTDVLHPRCAEQRVAAARGLLHRCPQCDGARVMGPPKNDPRSGFDYPDTCDLCAGEGWLAKAPVQKVTTTKTWVRP